MSEPTPEPQDTGDVAAVPEEQQLQEPDPDDHSEPTDLSDVSTDGEVVDLEAENDAEADSEAPTGDEEVSSG